MRWVFPRPISDHALIRFGFPAVEVPWVRIPAASLLVMPSNRVFPRMEKYTQTGEHPQSGCSPGWRDIRRRGNTLKKDSAVAILQKAIETAVFRPGIKVPGLQKMCYNRLAASVFPPDIGTIISRRIRDLFAPYIVPDFENSNASNVLRSIRKHDAMRVLKTWVNSWATSYRMHEPKLLPCVFGCPAGKDQLSHYVMCPILFALQTLLFPDCSPDPCKRIGLSGLSRQTALVISATFAGYHAVRRVFTLENDAHNLTDSLRHRNHLVFVDHFYTASLDAGLQCRHERLNLLRVTPICTDDGVCTAELVVFEGAQGARLSSPGL